MEPILAAEHLRKCYGRTEVVRDLSIEVHRGEFFSLLGPNGAGKSTTIGMLTGLIQPSGGRIVIGGVDLASNPMEAKGKIGLVPQNLALYSTLNARDNLLFFGRIYGLHGRRLKERIGTVLDIVALGDRARDAVATFSHGMKRRLNIAAGLLHEPEVLVLDEPTLGVDPQSRKAILENLERLNRSGVTILYTTHYIEEAQRLSQRVAIMDLGEVIALDKPLALIRNAGKGIIRMELNSGIDDGLVRELQAWGPVRVIDGEKKRIQVETERTGQALKDLISTLEKREGLLKALDVLEPNLETVFIHLTGRDLRD